MTLRLGLEFVERAASASSLVQLRRAADELAQAIDVEFWAIFEHADHRFDGVGALIWLHNYPSAFTSPYRTEGWVNHDIVPAATRATLKPFDWNSVRVRAKTAMQKAVLAEAASAGLVEGHSIPIRAARAPMASFTVAGRKEVSVTARPALELVAATFYETLLKLWPTSRQHRPDAVGLSPRERECLAWAAEGKSSSVIADILGLGRETVDEYLDRARRRYGVATRVQAIARAILEGEISPQA